jgi:hypothetical protein
MTFAPPIGSADHFIINGDFMKRFFSALLTSFVLVVYLLPITSTCTGNFVASKNSDVYHVSTCHYVDQIYDSNKIWFSTTDAAEKTGRRGCSKCKPQNSKVTKSSKTSGSNSVVSSYTYAANSAIYKGAFNKGHRAGYAEGYDAGVADERIKWESKQKNWQNEKESLKENASNTAIASAVGTFLVTSSSAVAIGKIKK